MRANLGSLNWIESRIGTQIVKFSIFKTRVRFPVALPTQMLMNTKAALAFILFFALRTACQSAPKPQEAQCKFSDGKKIIVTYSPERRGYRLSTNEPLIIARGITVPAGDYTIVRGWERNGAFLILQKATETGEASQLLRIPMSASTPSVPQMKDDVSFVSSGGRCTMQLASEKSNTLLSVELTEKNTDLPLIP